MPRSKQRRERQDQQPLTTAERSRIEQDQPADVNPESQANDEPNSEWWRGDGGGGELH